MSKKVLYCQYTNPAAYPPLEHSSIILADAGWQVLFLGITPLGDSQALRFPDYPGIHSQQLPPVPVGWRQKLHYLYFTLWVIVKTLQWRPDWVYASDLFSCPSAFIVSLFTHINIIYHEHDTPDNHDESLFIRILLWMRQKLAQHADICILPNEQRAHHFATTVRPTNSPMVVWNCPRLKEVAIQRQGNPAQTLSIWYHGTIVPQRVPLSLLDAIAHLPPQVSLYIIGYGTIGHAHYIDELQKHAKQLGISSRVIISKPLSRHLLLKECQKHDVGVSFMPPTSDDINMKHMVGASNKAFDYLACGMALMVSDLPEWHDLYVSSGYGLACNLQQPDHIAKVLRWYWEHPQERQEMGERGRERIGQDWNYEAQFAPVLAIMQGHTS